MKSNIGVVGLGVMGKSLVLNMLNNDISVSGYNRSIKAVDELKAKNYTHFQGYTDLKDFINSLNKPKVVLLMVPSGEAVDEMIAQILPLIDQNDIIMDGGNSFFKDSERRSVALKEVGIHFYAVGVSGGEKGALLGPSIMPSGDKEVYPIIEPILTKIAAKKNNESCCRYLGRLGAGHYVKMVHNGIEYADMQLIAETILIMKRAGYDNEFIANTLDNWNQGSIQSYLLEITSKIIREKEDDQYLVDLIEDISNHKGTGKWTAQQALEQDVNVYLISAAFMARLMSGVTTMRQAFHNTATPKIDIDIDVLKKAYSLGKITAYAQGFALYQDASTRFDYQLDLEAIATIFRAGCIIQSELLEELRLIFKEQPKIENILLAERFRTWFDRDIDALRQISALATLNALPTPLYQAAATYLNQLYADQLGANIIQAQRDFFGAHSFKRVDKEGIFHHEWE
ncbi:MAG: NADP-dependent phosphogluconate dehydrogenase [Erysipelotrichaceae bacterium]|nr:NADP-dependent phosphogluconate dehydrogenase [Erysipelotrichaceae bacterium]